ncbi:tetratricopeptide repeat protein [Gaetbulibacter sp. M240]|uniref:tetratricopeptide repeat protein n=1 Tax=Gaetbulibacter sp. M240 TaxID=3126511 RepID=UPI00374EC596
MGYFIKFLTDNTGDVFYIRKTQLNMMRYSLVLLLMSFALVSYSQEDAKALSEAEIKALKNARQLVYEGNSLLNNDEFTKAEMEYRKAISEQSSNVAGLYNLGNSYYKNGLYDEALLRQQEALKHAETKAEKHMAYHNIGNILMKNKKCKEAVGAYKDALRNDPTDDETRYNLVLAQDCAKKQENQNKDDKNKDKKDQDKDNKDQDKDKDQQDQKDQNKDQNDQNKDQKDQDKKDQDKENKEDEGKPKDDKKDEGKGDQDEKNQQPPKPRQGQLSPQQIKNLLEAMNNQEQKVQKKMNAEKQKGIKVKTDKDW